MAAKKKETKKNRDIYAVVRIKGVQYKVYEGDEILVDKFAKGEKLEPEVLLVKTKTSVKIGKPLVSGAKVSLKVLEDIVKGKKIHVETFKAKSRYRRKIGFRPQHTKLQVGKISL